MRIPHVVAGRVVGEGGGEWFGIKPALNGGGGRELKKTLLIGLMNPYFAFQGT